MPSFPIVGNNYRSIADQVALRNAEDGDELVLVREPDNKFDSNAVQVHDTAGHFLGYIPKSMNSDVAAHLDEGYVPDVCLFEGGRVYIEFEQPFEDEDEDRGE
jgi:hypothetical protein